MIIRRRKFQGLLQVAVNLNLQICAPADGGEFIGLHQDVSDNLVTILLHWMLHPYMLRRLNQEEIYLCCSQKTVQQLHQDSKKDMIFKKVQNFAFLGSLKPNKISHH